MPSPFPPDLTTRLPEVLAKLLRSADQKFALKLPRVQAGVESLEISASIIDQLLEGIWVLWAYPQWEPVRDRSPGRDPDDVTRLARELLATWDVVCERIQASSEPPPYYASSAGVRAATLRRAGLGEPVDAITPMERECIRETLVESSPYSDRLAPALWHAHRLGLDVEIAAKKIAAVPAPKVGDKDFKPQFTRMLHSVSSHLGDDADRPLLRRNVVQCVLQHFGWVADTPLERLPLFFAAAFAAGLAEARPGLLPGTDLVQAVRRVLNPDAIQELRA